MTTSGSRVMSELRTVPNIISLIRILFVGVFAWLLFAGYDIWAVIVLAISGFSDWLDGWIARRFDQMSKIGTLLDPAADRLFILVTLVGLAWRNFIPWWLVAIIVARELMLAPTLPLLRKMGYPPLPVHFVGKAGTFALLYAFPMLLLGSLGSWVGDVASILGWAAALWGTGLYWVAGGLYLWQFIGIWRKEHKDVRHEG